jgi:hypothetical protein
MEGNLRLKEGIDMLASFRLAKDDMSGIFGRWYDNREMGS